MSAHLITTRHALTMSSREISGLVEKRHDNVKRTIDTLAASGIIVRPQIEDEQNIDAMGRNRTTSVYHLKKRDTLVVVAQLSPEFTARVVDRWQELEAQTARLVIPAPGETVVRAHTRSLPVARHVGKKRSIEQEVRAALVEHHRAVMMDLILEDMPQGYGFGGAGIGPVLIGKEMLSVRAYKPGAPSAVYNPIKGGWRLEGEA